LMGSHGESPHKVLPARENAPYWEVAWSPAGNRIVCGSSRQEGKKWGTWVESVGLDGADEKSVFFDPDNSLGFFVWTPLGRFVYSRLVAPTQNNSDQSQNLWELDLDSRTGASRGNPRRLTDWSGFGIWDLASTSGGKRLSFVRGTGRSSAFVGDLADNGTRLLNFRRLNMDEYNNMPLTWAADSREVIFSSDRGGGTLQMYKQALDSGEPRLIAPAPDFDFDIVRRSPDGAWLVLQGSPHNSPNNRAFYRVAANGGAPQLLFQLPQTVEYRCTDRVANFCLYSEPTADGKELFSLLSTLSMARARNCCESQLGPTPTSSRGSAMTGTSRMMAPNSHSFIPVLR
jgi:Tol biopolymer transport system component